MSAEASALKLFIDNDGQLYKSQTAFIIKNLATKKARGEYKHDLAVKAFGYLAESGAKKYAKEFGSPGYPWNKMFDVATRKRVATELTNDFESSWSEGSYRDLLPKKYQPKPSSAAHARKAPTAHATKLVGKSSATDRRILEGVYTSREGTKRIPDAGLSDSVRRELTKRYGKAQSPAAGGLPYWNITDYDAVEHRVNSGGSAHARKKSPAQLNREINHALSSRGRR